MALLRLSNFHVSAYDRCAPAEVHLRDCDIDIALLDVRIPGRCGDDFAIELRRRCPNVAIVFITGEDSTDPLKAAVPDCLVFHKPFDPVVLLELLACFSLEGGYDLPIGGAIEARAREWKM